MPVPRTDFAALTMDVVGTLIRPARRPAGIYADKAADHGLWADPNALEPAYRDAMRSVPWQPDMRAYGYEVIEATFGRPVPEALKCAIWDAFSEPHNWALLPGAAEVCALPVAKAVLSNMDSRLYGILSGLQLGPIDFVVLPGEAGRPKPHEAMMQLACGFLRVAPEDVLHIGDSAADDGGMCQRTGATWLRVDPAGGPDLHAIRTAFAL